MRKILLILLVVILNLGCSGKDNLDENVALSKAKSCREQGHPDKAISIALTYLQEYPEDPDMKLLLAGIYFQQKKYPEAKALLEPAIKQYPNYADLTNLLTRIQNAENGHGTGSNNNADRNDANDAVPDDEAIFNKVKALKLGGDIDEAKPIAWKYLRQHPLSFRMMFLLVSMYFYEINHAMRDVKYNCE